MWLPGAGVGGEDLTAKSAKGAKKRDAIVVNSNTEWAIQY